MTSAEYELDEGFQENARGAAEGISGQVPTGREDLR
jgi:hypothetical protein